jgi:hypothetical protein
VFNPLHRRLVAEACAAAAAAAASLQCFLVSTALVLLSLSRSALILSASAINGWCFFFSINFAVLSIKLPFCL